MYPQLAYGNGAYFCYCCCPYVCTVCHHLTYGFEWMCECVCMCLCYVWYMMLSSSFHIPTSIFIVHILNLNSRVHERCAAPRFRALLFSLLSSLSVRLCFVVCAFSFEFCTQNVYSSVCLSVRLSGGVLNLKNIFIAAFIHFAVYPPLLLLYATIFVVVLFIHTLLLLVSFYFVLLLLFPLFASKFSLNA